MDISIIIVSYNTRQLLAACVDSVYDSLTGTGLQHEVIVVDNASADGSAAMVRTQFPQTRLIAPDENIGFAAANNLALQHASPARYYFCLNPDTVVRGRGATSAIKVMVDFLDATPAAGAAGARLIHPDGSFQHSAFTFPTLAQVWLDFFPLNYRLTESTFNGRYPRAWYAAGAPFPIDHPLGATLMVRGEVVQQVGAFDEGFFMYCEEIDWCMRIKRAGWEIYCVPQAEIVHHVGQSTKQFRDAMFVELWRSRYRLFAKHYSAAFRWGVRGVVRVGLARQIIQARWAHRRERIDVAELASRLRAYRQVWAM